MCSPKLRGDETAALVPHGWSRSRFGTPLAQESTEVTCQSKFRPSHPRASWRSLIHSKFIQALPVLSCPTVDVDAVSYQLLIADGGRVSVTAWTPRLEVLRVSRCVLGYITMDNAGRLAPQN